VGSITIIIAVVGREPCPVMVSQHIAPATQVTAYEHHISTGLTENHEGAVFDRSPSSVASASTTTQIKSQSIFAVLGHLMQQLVSQPEVAGRVIESHLELFPGTVEKVRSVVLLDQ